METDTFYNLENSTFKARWGDTIQSGFTATPNTLIKAQAKLGLSANDMVVLLNLIMHWWEVDTMPFPRMTTIAKRTGMNVRTVQRSMSNMKKLGYVVRREQGNGIVADLSGLKNKLIELAPMYTWQPQPGTTSAPSPVDKDSDIQNAALGETI